MCKRNLDMCVIKSLAIFVDLILLLAAFACSIKAFVLQTQFRSYEPVLQDSMMHLIPLWALVMFALAGAVLIYGLIALCANGFGMLICFCMLLIIHGLICFILAFYTNVQAHEMERSRHYRDMVDESPNITHKVDTMASLDIIQSDLQCCGLILGGKQYFNENIHKIPASCCKTHSDNCYGDEVWSQNCIDALETFSLVNFQWIYLMEFAFMFFLWTNAAVAYLHAMAVKQFFYY